MLKGKLGLPDNVIEKELISIEKYSNKEWLKEEQLLLH